MACCNLLDTKQVSGDERVHTDRASSKVVLIIPAGLKIDLLVLKVICILSKMLYLVAQSAEQELKS